MQARRNSLSKEIGRLKGKGEEEAAAAAVGEVARLKETMPDGRAGRARKVRHEER